MLKKSEICLDLKKIFKKRKDVLDVVLFGSLAKGKTEPNDIDVCIIFRENTDSDFINELNQEKRFERIHFSALTADNFFRNPHTLIRSVLFEGKSLITNKKLSNLYGLNAYAMFTYDIRKLQNSKKVRFLYALKGRKNQTGIVEDFKGRFIAKNAFIIPVGKDREMIEVMEMWNIKFERKQIFLIS